MELLTGYRTPKAALVTVLKQVSLNDDQVTHQLSCQKIRNPQIISANIRSFRLYLGTIQHSIISDRTVTITDGRFFKRV